MKIIRLHKKSVNMMKHLAKFKWLVINLLLISCGPNQDNSQEQSYPVSQVATEEVYYVNDQQNQEIGRMIIKPELRIEIDNQAYFTNWSNEKRKYSDVQGNTIFEVKYSDDGFKVRNADGQMLWKVKVYDNKIKVADDEEMEQSYEIKVKNQFFAEILNQEQVEGTVELDPRGGPAKIGSATDTLFFAGPKASVYAGVVKLAEIDPLIRYIILSELLSVQ